MSSMHDNNNNNPMGNYAIVKIRTTYLRRTHMCASQTFACTDVAHHGVCGKETEEVIVCSHFCHFVRC